MELARERGLGEDPVVRQKRRPAHDRGRGILRLNAWRGLTAIMKTGIPGPEGSLAKWQWSEVNQALTELAMDILGEEAPLRTRDWTYGSSAPARTRSRAAPPRSSRTSWPSACSGCRAMR